MSYIRKVITHEEKLLLITHPHWIYAFEGLFWFAALTLTGFAIDHYLYVYAGLHAYSFNVDLWILHFDENHTPIPWLFSLAGLAVLMPLALIYTSNEIGLTDQRVIHKKGLIFIEIDQVDLEDIRAEQVYHGWFGWLLGYGKIHFDCRFIGDFSVPAISKPYRMVKASHTARLKHPLIEYGQDVFRENIAQIDEWRRRAHPHARLQAFQQRIKDNFRKAS